jgi:SH3-like domain-containing protein
MLRLRDTALVLLCLALPSAAVHAQLPGRAPQHPRAAHARSMRLSAVKRLPIPPIPPPPSRPVPEKTAHAITPPKPVFDPNKGSVTGLPIPRYVSLRADAVNLRSGPGDRYPIDWMYKRVGMPVEILREFDVWRLVETPDGEKGWMHEATLVGRRDFIIHERPETLRTAPDDNSRPIAVLELGVIGHIRSCGAGAAWCRVDIKGYSGWLQRNALWGLLPNEAIKP